MLKIVKLSLSYPSKHVFTDFSLELPAGTICALTGANGSGKSSLLSAISGVIPEHHEAKLSGSIWWKDTDLRSIPLRNKLSYLWQALSEADSQFFFPTLEAELAFALENQGVEPRQISRRIRDSATYFGFRDRLHQSPLELSGGQKKILLCAIADVINPPLLLLDEPANGLSAKALNLLCQWLIRQKQSGTALLIAEHNASIIGLADMVCKLW